MALYAFDGTNDDDREIGTDPKRFEGSSKKFGEYYNTSWFSGDYKIRATDGYQAPPLDGIWATAPYLHNNSVGEYNGDPSIAGRMAAYEDGMSKLL